MQIIETKKFKEELRKIVDFIAIDKKSAAIKFAKELQHRINQLENFPYKYRASYYYEQEQYRDMTYKGYTIIYKIDTKKETLFILSIFSKNKPLTSL